MTDSKNDSTGHPSLQARLDEMRESAEERIPAEARQVMHRATRELIDSGRPEEALGEGATAPDFELEDTDGHRISSRELRARGPLVVTFYRGVW